MDIGWLPILVCPVDGAGPLALTELRTAGRADMAKGDAEDALLACPECGRVYPVVDGVAHLVRESLRWPDRERRLIERHGEKIPGEMKRRLILEEPPRPEDDARLVAEGRYWSDFFNAYYAVGGQAIFDIEARGTHPPFYPYGIMERDERDRGSRYGFFPAHIGRKIFGAMERHAMMRGTPEFPQPSLALDIGCGGGQMALEAARRGMDVFAFDVAVGALETGHRHTREAGHPVNFVYADPMQLPFKSDPGQFDLLVCKDALHHLPDAQTAVENLWRAAAEGAVIISYEHVADTAKGRRTRERLHQKYIPRLMARYGTTDDIPAVIREQSPHEDVGAAALEPALRRCFTPRVVHREHRLYLDIAQMAYFVSGKSMAAARVAEALALAWERANAFRLPPEFLLLIGTKRERL